jgi:hypothetical protein
MMTILWIGTHNFFGLEDFKPRAVMV